MYKIEPVVIEFPSDQSSIIEKIRTTSFKKIIITNIESAQEALSLLTPQFISEVERRTELIRVHFKINQNFEENFGDDLQFIKEKSAIVTFETTTNQQYKSKIFWTIAGDDKFFSVGTSDEHVSEFSRFIIADEIKYGRAGILEGYKNKKITLASIGNDKGDNLLTLAAKRGYSDIVERLIKLGFDVDYENNEELMAIDIAWKECKSSTGETRESFNKIILNLLNSNSRLPQKAKHEEFDLRDLSKDIQNFVVESENLRTLIRNEDLITLKLQVKQKPNLCYFYDRDNQSLIAFAVQEQNLKIFDDLISLGLGIGKNEDINFDKIPHLFVLKAKSRIANGHHNSNGLWSYVHEAYNFLDENKISSKILEVAATWRRLKIEFKTDLNEDPVESVYAVENIYLHGCVIIDASSLLDESNKFEVFAALLRELCYLAISITFMNGSKPYPRGSSEAKHIFDEKIQKFCKEDFTIPGEFSNDSFSLCCKKLVTTKLIVVIIPMLLAYWRANKRSEKFKKVIIEMEQRYDVILKYYEEVVSPKFEESLKVLPKLQDEKQDIGYSDLTQPMQLKIQTSKINFQGFEVSPLGLFDDLLKFLSDKNIRGVLIDNKKVKLGDPHRDRLDLKLVERKFINTNDEGKKDIIIKDLRTIQEEVSKVRICVIADHPGTGKTNAFRYIAKKLKEKNETFFVIRSKLRRYRELYDEYHPEDIENIDDVCEIFERIIQFSFKQDSKFELEVFRKLFMDSKIIFLLDGFDEICPEYFEFWIKIFQILKEQSQIHLWISTRPFCVKKLRDVLNVEVYKLAPLTWNEKEDVIRLFISADDSNELLHKINSIFFNTFGESCQSFVNNPLILQVIAETSSKGNKIEQDFKNPYKLFKIVIDAHKEKVDAKVDEKDQRAFLIISFADIHQVFALKYLFGSEYEELKLNELEIINKWEENKKAWTSEMIQRYGFLTVEVEDLNLPIHKDLIKFIHNSFIEFFVANYLYALITDNRNPQNSKITCVFLKIISSDLQKFETVLGFLLDHLKDDSKDIDINLFDSFKDNIKNIRSTILRTGSVKHSLLLLEFWSFMFSKNVNILHELWLVSQKNNLLKIFLLENFGQQKLQNGLKKCEFLRHILKIVEASFDSDWCKVLGKNSNENQVDIIGNTPQELYHTNLIRLLLLIEDNYENHETQTVFEAHFYDSCLLNNISEDIGIPILNIASRIFKNNKKMLLKVIIQFLEYSPIVNIENVLKFFRDQVENTFKNDRKSIRKLLLNEYSFKRHPLFLALNLRDAETFMKIKGFYVNYKKELQKLFTSVYELPKIIMNVSPDNQQEFTNFMIEIFQGHEDQILNFICDDHQICFNICVSDEYFKFFNDFSHKLFCDNHENANKIIKKVLLHDCSEGNHPFILALESKDITHIKNIKIHFKNQKISADDLKIILHTPEKLLRSLQFVKDSNVYEELEEIFAEILSTKEEIRKDIARSTRKYLQRKNSEEISSEQLKYLSKFLAFVSENPQNHNYLLV